MKDNLLDRLKNTQIFDKKTKNNLIKYFDKLNNAQLNLLEEALSYERQILLNFLKGLKESRNLTIYDLKSSLNRVNIKMLQEEELQQKITETKNILDLLDTAY